ncbi:MAG TPA: hypothetical protein VEY71_01285 [Chitinophagales bacterium]|nr:hypothetical protein [Chitinophagales bacterium]
MKNIFLLLVITMQLSCKSYSQNSVKLTIGFKPSQTYHQNMNNVMKSVVTYRGSEEVLSDLEKKGLVNPTVSENSMEMQAVMKTGEMKSDGSFPFYMEILKASSSTGQKEIPDGLKIYGSATKNNKVPKLDSVASDQLSAAYKQQLLQVMQNLFSQISFPEKEYKVGDTSVTKTPVAIPIGNVHVSMTVTTTYSLVEIKNGIATFDISTAYSNVGISDNVLGGTGSGKGKMIYDVEKEYYKQYDLSTRMNMQVAMDQVTLDVVSNSDMKMSIDIK